MPPGQVSIEVQMGPTPRLGSLGWESDRAPPWQPRAFPSPRGRERRTVLSRGHTRSELTCVSTQEDKDAGFEQGSVTPLRLSETRAASACSRAPEEGVSSAPRAREPKPSGWDFQQGCSRFLTSMQRKCHVLVTATVTHGSLFCLKANPLRRHTPLDTLCP